MGKKVDKEAMLGLEFETKNNGKCFIIDYKKYKDVTVMFYDGYIVKTKMGDLKRGSVGKGDTYEWCKVGTVFQTNFHGECEVVGYRTTSDIDVKFKDGTIVNVRGGNLKKGVVKNPNTPKIFGVATNDLENYTDTKIFKVWHSMIRRCYSDVYHKNRPAYDDVTVQESWLKFSNFKKDIESLPFSDYCEKHNYEFDKDILSDGSRMYKLETISFVPKEINSAFINDIRFGKYKGWYVNSQGFFAPSTSGVMDEYRKNLGCKTSYRTSGEALNVYKTCKKLQLQDLAEKYKGMIDVRVYNKLINYDFELEITD